MVGLSATAETAADFEVYFIRNDHFGPCLDLPNGTAQWATNYGVMNLTHRRVHHGNMVGFLQIQWLHLLCEPVRLSVKARMGLKNENTARLDEFYHRRVRPMG